MVKEEWKFFSAADGLDLLTCREILESLLYNTETKVVCRIPGNRFEEHKGKTNKRPVDSTVTLKAGKETSAYLLKNKVGIKEIVVDKRRIWRMGKGDLIFTVESKREEANALKS